MSLCGEAFLRLPDEPDSPWASPEPGSTPAILILWFPVHWCRSLQARTVSYSSPPPTHLMCAEHWVNVRWGAGWVPGWEVDRKVGNARTPSWSQKRASRDQSFFRRKNKLSRSPLLCQLHKQVSESSHCTDGFLWKGKSQSPPASLLYHSCSLLELTSW